jgi:hypothetical protein
LICDRGCWLEHKRFYWCCNRFGFVFILLLCATAPCLFDFWVGIRRPISDDFALGVMAFSEMSCGMKQTQHITHQHTEVAIPGAFADNRVTTLRRLAPIVAAITHYHISHIKLNNNK